jgi:ubiquinone/menaquinone biosynthesis C-methylase UbiE
MSALSRNLAGMSKEQKQEHKHQAADDLIALLDAVDEMPHAQELRARSYELLAAQPGAAVVDVGCGAGRAVGELVERGVKAVGVDPTEQMIDVARRRWSGADFRLAGAYGLPFREGVLDGYRADKVFHVLDDPARALAEARRVLAPGGRVVLVGQDWDTFVIDSDAPELTRVIVHARADLVENPRVARRHRNLLLEAGFLEVSVEVHTGLFTDAVMLPMLLGMAEAACAAGAVGRTEADAWSAEQRDRSETDRLFVALPMFVASAERPQ